MNKTGLCAAVACLLTTACTHRLTDFTVLTTKNADLTRVHEYRRQTTRVTGSDSVYIIIIIPTGMLPNLKDAVDRAIESVSGGVALVDGVVRLTHYYIPLIFGENCYTVEGEVLWDPKLGDGSIKQKLRVSRRSEDG